MKWFTFQTLLICTSSILCNRYCAHIDFNSTDIFDSRSDSFGTNIGMKYKKEDKYCFISFSSNSMPKDLSVSRIYDCSEHFNGTVKAGSLAIAEDSILKKNKCYYQHDWIFCVCNVTYCNSPQYWPLMLARFSHDFPDKTRKKSKVFEEAEKIRNMLKLNVTVNKNTKMDYRENLRCLVWYSDTLFQEEENPRFYFYNYITTLHRAPPLADALTTPPVERKEIDWGTKENFKMTKIFTTEKEPFEDGTHETDRDYRTFPFEVKQDMKNLATASILVVSGIVVFTISLVITVYFLWSICRRVQNHSLFTRTNDDGAKRRYKSCFKSPQLPIEFVKRRRHKKSDAEAGPSIKSESQEQLWK